MNTLRCILVDDEPLALRRFRTLLKSISDSSDIFDIEIAAEAENGVQAVPLIYSLKPDIVFLDIQMPMLGGFEVLDLLAEPRPHIVFVTAYDEFALRAFEVHALDYLTKPVSAKRLESSLRRLAGKQNFAAEQSGLNSLKKERELTPLTRIAVYDGNSLRVISTNEILHIEAHDKSITVYLPEGGFQTDFTLDSLELRLDSKHFLRVHRSHIVRIDAVREIIPWFSGTYCLRLSDGVQLPVARRRVSDIKALFGKK